MEMHPAARFVAASVLCASILGSLVLGVGRLVGHPGPFVLLSFALGAMPPWTFVRSRRVVAAIAATIGVAAWLLPAYLLTVYTGDGDFTYAELASQLVVLFVLSHAFAWLGSGRRARGVAAGVTVQIHPGRNEMTSSSSAASFRT